MSSVHFPLASEQPHQKEPECQVTQKELESQVTRMMDFKEAEESPGRPAKLDSTMAVVVWSGVSCVSPCVGPVNPGELEDLLAEPWIHSTAPVICPLVLDSEKSFLNPFSLSRT